MKNLFKFILVIGSFFSLNQAYASDSNPRWVAQCRPAVGSLPWNATMYAIGTSAVVSLTVGYETAELVCSFNGPCAGIRFGSETISAGDARLIRVPGSKVPGFTYKGVNGQFTFVCK